MSAVVDDLLAGAAVYFGSSLGRVENVAKQVAAQLGVPTLVDLHESPLIGAGEHRLVVLAMSTWHDGVLQDDWRARQSELFEIDWSGTLVAMACLGDQYGYPRTFGDALGIVAEAIEPRGATLIGAWDLKADPIGYEFRKSRGLRDGRFIGLVIDEDNQPTATDERVRLWCQQVRSELESAV